MNSQEIAKQWGIALVLLAVAFALSKYTNVNKELQKIPPTFQWVIFTLVGLTSIYFFRANNLLAASPFFFIACMFSFSTTSKK